MVSYGFLSFNPRFANECGTPLLQVTSVVAHGPASLAGVLPGQRGTAAYDSIGWNIAARSGTYIYIYMFYYMFYDVLFVKLQSMMKKLMMKKLMMNKLIITISVNIVNDWTRSLLLKIAMSFVDEYRIPKLIEKRHGDVP